MFSANVIASFQELDYKIYEYVMAHAKEVSYMRIRELAEVVGVSTTSILRFCKKVDCVGFSEFKLKFKLYLEQTATQRVEEGFGSIIDCLKKMDTPHYIQQIKKIVKEIQEHTYVMFLGIGNSGTIARYGARCVSSAGKFALYLDDPFYRIEGIYEDCVVIALSVSGETNELIDELGRFQKYQSYIISITASANSTVAKMSNFNLAYYLKQEELVSDVDITSQIPTVSIIEAISRELINQQAKAIDRSIVF